MKILNLEKIVPDAEARKELFEQHMMETTLRAQRAAHHPRTRQRLRQQAHRRPHLEDYLDGRSEREGEGLRSISEGFPRRI